MGGWTVVLVTLFVAIAAALLWALLNVEEDIVQAVAGFLEVLLALGVAFVGVRAWLARRRRTTTPEQRDSAVNRLADEMRLRLQDEPNYRALTAPEPVALRWRVRPPLLPAGDASSPCADSGEGPAALVDLMSCVGSLRIALIGQRGAGKTTLAALVAEQLLLRGRRESLDPVPIIVSLADWDPRVDGLERWISLRLAAQFPELKDRSVYGRDAALSVVQHGRIFPILDGLDEIRDEFVKSALGQIRRFASSAPIIITCRTEVFERLASDGRLAPRMNTVELEPLAGADVIPFLIAAIEDRSSEEQRPWRRLIAQVRSEPGDPLTVALDTPLIAWLLWAAYARTGRDPSLLLDRARLPSAESIEQHLLRDFPSMALAGASAKEKARSERWLAFMARRAKSRDVHAITWWAVPLMAPRAVRRAVTVAAACVLITPLAATDPAFAPFFGLLLGLVPRLEPVSVWYRAPLHVRSWETTRDRLRRSLGIGGAIATGVIVSFFANPKEPLLGTVLLALVLGGAYAAISEVVQRGVANAREKLHLPLRRVETVDSPPPVIGLTWDWSRAVLVLALSAMFGFVVGLPDDDRLAGFGAGLAMTIALSPFVWFGRSSAAAPFQRQRELFWANLRYSLCRGALLALIVPALLLSVYLADGQSAFGDAESASEPLSVALGILVAAAASVPLFAVGSALIAPCGQHILALVLLAPVRRLPWRPNRFFEHLHELGVLRRSGLGYEFRHERLRDSLVSVDRPARRWRRMGERAAVVDEADEAVIGA